jgi:hypothetical protein
MAKKTTEKIKVQALAGTARINFRAPAELERAFRIRAAELGISKTKLYIKLMEAYLKGKFQLNGV